MSVQTVSPEKAVEVLIIELESKQDKIAELKAKIDEQAATIARLTAANENERKLNDTAFLDNLAALKKQAEEIIALKKACIVYHNQIINMQKAEEE